MNRLVFLVLVIFYAAGSAQSQSVQFEHLTQENGISSNINTILKDSYGFMWFGSFGGLKRYDGYNVVSFNHNPQDPSTINEDYVRCLIETKDSTLLVGFQFHGFCIYDREKETFTRFKNDPKNLNSLSNDFMLAIYEDTKGRIWIGTRGGLDQFDLKTKTFKHYNPFNGGADKSFVTSITEDSEGNLWMCGMSNKVCKFDPATGKSEFFQFADRFNERSFVHGGIVKFDTKGNLWVGMEEIGLIRYNLKSNVKQSFNSHLTSTFVYSIIEDKEGLIWIGTDGGGLYKYDYKDNSVKCFLHNSYDLTSLNSNAIYCVYESEPGIIWVGTFSSGLNIYKKYKRKFISYSNVGEQDQRLSHKSVLSIKESADKKIWMGTDGGGLNLFDLVQKKFQVFNEDNSPICGNVIKSLMIDKEKNIWAGTYAKGLCKINPSTWEVSSYRAGEKGMKNSLESDNVWCLMEGTDNKIWVGLIGSGLNLYDKTNNDFSSFIFDSTALKKYANSSVFVIFEDSKRRVWIGTESLGLICYDRKRNLISKMVHNEANPKSLSNNSIRDIFEDSKGNIWVATIKGGLNKLVDFEKKEFVHFTVKNGLPTNETQDILEDDRHNLWISTINGLSLYKAEENKFINFSKEDGLAGKEFNYQSALKASNGYLYFGGINGVTLFHPDSIKYNAIPPKVYINDLKIFNRSVSLDKKYFEKAVYLTKEVHLNPADNVFTISFAAISYLSPVKNKFAYKLEGFDKDYNYVNADYRSATYTNLDPGEYIFKVIASNNDGVWNREGAWMKIIIHPPWYNTWLFKAILVSLVLLFIGGFYRVRIDLIKKQNALLEKEVQARTLSLQEKQDELEKLNRTKDRLFSIIAHDLRNPVTALHLLTDLLRKELKDKANANEIEIIHHVHKSSGRVKELVLNLLEWAKTQSVSVKVEKAGIQVIEIFREEIRLHDEQARQKDLMVTAEVPEGCFVTGDKNMIRTVVRNILNNSIKYTPAGGTIRLFASATNDLVTIAIQDSGVGMSESILKNLFDVETNPAFSTKGTQQESGTGLGMMICNEFAKLNNGRLYAESQVGKGSIFYFELPGGIKPL